MTFEPGQRVVCVDADGAPQLRLKGIYTVKSVTGPSLSNWRSYVVYGYALWLYETEAAPHYKGFAGQRFRPIQGRETNISLFTDMLIDVPVDA